MPSDNVSEVLARIDSWIADVEAQWVSLGVPARTRRLLAADLQRDLEQTAMTGVDADLLLDRDVARFARDLAEANGIDFTSRTASVKTVQLIRTAVAGGLLGAAFAWFVLYPLWASALGNAPDIFAAIVLYATIAITTILGAVGLACWRYRGRPDIKAGTLVRLGVGFTVGGPLSVDPTMQLAGATGYSWGPVVVLAEVCLVAACCAGGMAVALRYLRWPASTTPSVIA